MEHGSMTRRGLLLTAPAGLGLLGLALGGRGGARAADDFAVTHTDAEWRKLLKPDQYEVLRKSATERPFSSPLDHE